MINEQGSTQYPASMPDEQRPPTTYLDALNRDWQYWPSSAADQMWREATCNQSDCDRPAATASPMSSGTAPCTTIRQRHGVIGACHARR
jgi:hypothetical protein